MGIKGAFKKIFIRGKKQREPVLPPFPYYICLETTNACNLTCKQCIYHGEAAGDYKGAIGFIDVGLAKKILDQLKPHKCHVMLNGDGEALLHPHFQEIARYAVALGLPDVYFNTNGTLMTPGFTDEFVKYFRGSVSFSLDGFKESHERLRRGSSYETVCRHIDYLLEQIKKTKAAIKVGVAYCNYDQPAGECEKFSNYWIERVDTVSIGEVYDKNYHIVSPQINQPVKKERLLCKLPWETFIVRWFGKVAPCSSCFSLGEREDVILGDARTQSLQEIWEGEVVRKLRRRLLEWKLKDSICESCERWNMYVGFPDEEKNDIMIRRTGVFTTYSKKKSYEIR